MKSRAKLHIVKDPPKDLTLAMREEIEARDWAKVHCEGDRRKPLFLFDRVKRTWR